MATALQMIAERGLGGLSTREIARRADISEALIFHHYGTKAGLLSSAARSGDTLLARILEISDSTPPADMGEVIDSFVLQAVDKMRPGSPGHAFRSALMSDDPKVSDVREEGLALLAQAQTALADWMERSPRPPRFGGVEATRTLLEGVLWRLATLPNSPREWDAAAPAAFKDLAARWRALHLEN